MKMLYFDTETGGLNPKENPLTQIAGVVEINGEVVEKFDIKMKPFPGQIVNDTALKVQNRTLEEIMAAPDPRDQFFKLLAIFNKYVKSFDRNDKFIVAAQNGRFDVDFLHAFFVNNENPKVAKGKYQPNLFAYFWPIPLDLLHIARAAQVFCGFNPKNLKLGSICEALGIELVGAHDALADVLATRLCILELKRRYFKDVKRDNYDKKNI